jgi:hypothetical protein
MSSSLLGLDVRESVKQFDIWMEELHPLEIMPKTVTGRLHIDNDMEWGIQNLPEACHCKPGAAVPYSIDVPSESWVADADNVRRRVGMNMGTSMARMPSKHTSGMSYICFSRRLLRY